MKIPVFVSCPTDLSEQQSASRSIVVELLEGLNLEPRALGRSDYPTDLPLREVAVIAKHCAGGIILGFSQFESTGGTWKKGTLRETNLDGKVMFPTPWNHLEAGILYGLGLPLLIFREDGIGGGVFDNGVTDVFVHQMPSADAPELKEVFLKWRDRVGQMYYDL